MDLLRRTTYRVLLAGACGLGMMSITAAPASAAEWLAPAPQAQLTADWVKDVAKALRSNRYKNVFMNQPFGCDQCRILEYLDNAAEALEGDEPKLAESFVRRALNVLDEGVEDRWYDEADIRPIKRLIVKKAKQGFEQAGAPKLALSMPERQDRDSRYERGDEPLFDPSAEARGYGSRRDRWSGYTSGDRFGLTNEPPDRNGRSRENERYRESDIFSDQFAEHGEADRGMQKRSTKQKQEMSRHSGSEMSRKDSNRQSAHKQEQNKAKGDNRVATADESRQSGGNQ